MASSKIENTGYNCVQLEWNRKKAKSVFNDLKEIAQNYEFGVDEEQEFYFRAISNELVKRYWIGKGVRLFEPKQDVDDIINEYDVLVGQMTSGDNYLLTVKDTDSQTLYGIRRDNLQLPECIPSFGSNLAQGKTVATSPTGTGQSNLVDGVAATEWDSGAIQAIGHYIQVDLGEVISYLGSVRINSSEVTDPRNCFADRFKILISSTGDFAGEETEVFASTEDFAITDPVITFVPTSGRYVRVVITQAKAVFHWQVGELEVKEWQVADITRWATSKLNEAKDPIQRGTLDLDSCTEKILPRGKVRVTSEDGLSYHDYPLKATRYRLSPTGKLSASLQLGAMEKSIGDELLTQRRLLREFSIAGISRDADLVKGTWIQDGHIKRTYIGKDGIETPMLRANSIRAVHYHELRNTYVFSDQDSLDATYPLEMLFEIISEMTAIVNIKLSFKIRNFRAYSKGAASGGGHTSGSGGGQTSSSTGTPSGGGSTSGSQGTPSGGGSTSGSATHNHSGSTASGGMHFHDIGYQSRDTSVENGHVHGYDRSDNNTEVTETHLHSLNISDDGAHSHSTPNHTHPGHTHSTPNHTHPEHTHTVSNHTHSVSNHTHSLTFGIYEYAQSPTINVYVDNGAGYGDSIGQYTTDQTDLDISAHVSAAGIKQIKFTSNVLTRLSCHVLCKVDLTA